MGELRGTVKRLAYRGFHPPRTSAQIAYIIAGSDVVFTALENVVIKTTTINAADEIVQLLCEAEGLDWQKCAFFDLQTWVSYPYRPKGYYNLDQLVLVFSDELRVESWIPRAKTDESDFMGKEIKTLLRLLESGR